MEDFVFHIPTKIVFGKNKVGEAGRHVKQYGKKVLMLYGKESIKRTGVYDTVIDSLKKEGLDIIEHPGVKSNPVVSHAKKGIQLARENEVDCILAVGGGSVIDESKCVAAGYYHKGDVWDFYLGTEEVKKALPLVTVLTIPATASEMNNVSVITNDDTKQKIGFGNENFYPRVSIMDPSVTYTVPADYTAYSAVDVIAHMLEGYFTNEAGWIPIQDRYVEGLVKTVMESTERILDDPEDYQGRATFMWAATLAFNGLAVAGVGDYHVANHMFGHILGGHYDIPHGATLSIIIPAWMQYKLEEKAGKFAKLAEGVFGIRDKDEKGKAKSVTQELKKWFKKIGAPVSFKDANIPTGELEILADAVLDLAGIWGIKGYTKDIVIDIFKLAL